MKRRPKESLAELRKEDERVENYSLHEMESEKLEAYILHTCIGCLFIPFYTCKEKQRLKGKLKEENKKFADYYVHRCVLCSIPFYKCKEKQRLKNEYDVAVTAAIVERVYKSRLKQ